MGAIALRGIGWDHERCLAPLTAAASAWAERRPGTVVEWDSRSLAAFNDQPIDGLAETYDLIVVDHPFVGAAAETSCLVPLERVLPAGELASLEAAGRLPRRALGPGDGLAAEAC